MKWNDTEYLPGQALVQDAGYVHQNIQPNRDYFMEAKPGYTPYTYPHPLVT